MTSAYDVTSLPLEEMMAVVGRLQTFLPEYARTRTDEKIAELATKIINLEDELARTKERIREETIRLLRTVFANWDDREIETACGYQLDRPEAK